MILASEGGFQDFTLGGAEWFWLLFSAATAVLALLVGFALSRGVLHADQGTPKMREIASAIQEGAMAYLRRQFKTIAVILVPVAVLVFLTSTAVLRPNGSTALSVAQSGLFRTLAFVTGCLMSGLTGFIGMSLAVRSLSVARTAYTPTIEASTPMARQASGKMSPSTHLRGSPG